MVVNGTGRSGAFFSAGSTSSRSQRCLAVSVAASFMGASIIRSYGRIMRRLYMPLPTGTRIGAYEILAPLGAGGMGEVYRARDTRLGRDVAIKTLPEDLNANPERLMRLQREAQLLATLNHPHIATIHSLEALADGTHCLVLELVEGESLADMLSRGRLPFAQSLTIARQIVDGVEAAHDKGIVHRDLKPANVMVTHDGHVKVLDFGLARAVEGDGSVSVTNSPTLSFAATQAGVILGTAAYMSPEQAKGRVADKRTDVWAFGCVLYEMLTGKPCFEGEDVADTLAFILTREPDWGALPLDTPRWIGYLLRWCFDKDRRRRVGDIAAALFAIDDARMHGNVRLPCLRPSPHARSRYGDDSQPTACLPSLRPRSPVEPSGSRRARCRHVSRGSRLRRHP